MVTRSRRPADAPTNQQPYTAPFPRPEGRTGVNRRLQKSPFYLELLGWAVTVAIAIFAYLNIAPYEQAILELFSSNQASGLADFLLGVPVIGVMVRGAIGLLAWLSGAVLWFVLQTLELLPVLLFNNRRALKGVIQQSAGNDVLQISPNDDPALANLKKAYNRLPYRIVRQFRNYSLCAYVVDLCICLTVYPPVDGGFAQAILILTTGAFRLVNWGNVGMLLVTLFAVEVLVSIAFMVSDLRDTLARGEAHDQL